MDLQTGETREFEAVSEQRFDASGSFVTLRGYPPDEPSGKGADLRIITLATGTEDLLRQRRARWSGARPDPFLHSLSRRAPMWATACRCTTPPPASCVPPTLPVPPTGASAGAMTLQIWLPSARAPPPPPTAPAYDVLAWRDLDRRVETMVIGASAAGIPDTLETVHHRAPAWSDDGSMISLGLRPIEKEIEKEEDDDPADGTEDEPEAETEPDEGSPDAPASDSEPDLPALQIWHTGDVRLFPEQQVSEDRDNTRSLLAVWHLDDDRVVVLGSDLMGTAQLLHG